MKKNLYIGGYSILDLNDTNVYAQALICAKQNKPVLVYDDPLRYYADTITIDTDNDDNVVITKGGKTITITDANSVSSEGDIQKKSYQHNISYRDTYDKIYDVNFSIISDKSNMVTNNSELGALFDNITFNSNYDYLEANGYIKDGSTFYIIFGIKMVMDGTTPKFYGYVLDTSTFNATNQLIPINIGATSRFFYDKVVTI